jgi:hypothetical protein
LQGEIYAVRGTRELDKILSGDATNSHSEADGAGPDAATVPGTAGLDAARQAIRNRLGSLSLPGAPTSGFASSLSLSSAPSMSVPTGSMFIEKWNSGIETVHKYAADAVRGR